MKIHPLITKTDDLQAFVDRLSSQPFIAVDTEFMRENTYWPDLCLIQVASTEEAAAIDPKAEGIDLKPLLGDGAKDKNVTPAFAVTVLDGVAYVIVNNKAEGSAPASVALLARALVDAVG